MPRESAPWFPFDAVAFLADLDQAAMTLEEVGAYIRLLAWAWREGPLPSDLKRLARILAIPERKLRALWPALAPCWTMRDDGTMVNERLERERQRKDEVSLQRSVLGSKGAAARWQKPDDGDGKGHDDAIANAWQTDAHARVPCLSVSLSSVSEDPKEGKSEGETAPNLGDVWDRWTTLAAEHGAKQPLVAGPGNFEHVRVLVASYTPNELDRAMVAWWASPHTGGRNLGMFRAQVGEVLEHLQRQDGTVYRAPKPKAKAEEFDIMAWAAKTSAEKGMR